MKLSDLITENDGVSLCPVRIVGLLGAAQFFALTLYQTLHTHAFDVSSYGSALAAVIGAVGLAFSAKSFQEGKTDRVGNESPGAD